MARSMTIVDHRLEMIAESELIDNLNGLAKAVAVYEPLGSQEGKLIDEVGALSPTLPSTNQSALS